MKSLYSLFESEYRVIVIERLGYGFSDDTTKSRNIKTMVEEMREVANKITEVHNYILFPHSMAGLLALYWTNMYQSEIMGIIDLDMVLPQVYANMNISIMPFLLRLISLSKVYRILPIKHILKTKYHYLKDNEIKIYKNTIIKNLYTKAMHNETKYLKENAKLVEGLDNTQVPMLLFISNGKGTLFKKKTWQSIPFTYLKKKTNSKYVLLECGHFLHNIKPQEIYKQSKLFLEGISIK